MRVEAIVVTSRAQWARRDVSNAGRARLLGDELTKIHAFGRPRRFPPGELAKDIRTNLVARTADGGTEVNPELAGGESTLRQRFDATLDNACGGSPPPLV